MALLTRTRPRSSADRASAAATEAIERARDVAGPTVERAREATAPGLEWAREAAEPTVERAREASAPALAHLRSVIATLLRTVVRVAALLPGFGAQVLEAIATLMGRLADTSASLAHLEPPSRAGRRRAAGLWFVGGFVTGAAAGYAAHELLAGEPEDDHVHDDEGPGPRATTAPDRGATSSAQVPG